MRINDETYKGMWISPQVIVILKTDNPTSDGPVAWVSPFKDSRVVFIQLGHGELAHRHAGYRRLVRNAILWSGGRLGQ
jgi:type 1 glutamine amidotransferase